MRVFNTFLFLLLTASVILAQTDFTASDVEGCSPFAVKFDIDQAKVDMDTINYITWDFGLGDTINSLNPDTIIFNQKGDFTIKMSVNGYSSNATIKPDYIKVHQTLNAAFAYREYNTGYNYIFQPLDTVIDSTATYNYTWNYLQTDGSIAITNNYLITINNQEIAQDTVTLDTGSFSVSLRIEDNFGCSSQFQQTIYFTPSIIVPNVFIPESQEFYIIDPDNSGTVLFFQVFNRNGLLVFEQTAPIIHWDGKTSNGLSLNTGVYFYILEAVNADPSGKYNKKGFIHIYR